MVGLILLHVLSHALPETRVGERNPRKCLACAENCNRMRLSPYIAMATANLEWVAWREGKNAEAEQLGKTALELWQSSEMVYPFHWAALWPLIDIMLGRMNSHKPWTMSVDCLHLVNNSCPMC